MAPVILGGGGIGPISNFPSSCKVLKVQMKIGYFLAVRRFVNSEERQDCSAPGGPKH